MSNFKHGRYAYGNHGCRCEACTTDHSKYLAERRAERRELRIPDGSGRLVAPTWVKHGTPGGYSNWYCRCVACTDAWAASARRARAST